MSFRSIFCNLLTFGKTHSEEIKMGDQSVNIPFSRRALSQRILWTTVIIGGFIIGSSYSGSLSSFMTIPR